MCDILRVAALFLITLKFTSCLKCRKETFIDGILIYNPSQEEKCPEFPEHLCHRYEAIFSSNGIFGKWVDILICLRKSLPSSKLVASYFVKTRSRLVVTLVVWLTYYNSISLEIKESHIFSKTVWLNLIVLNRKFSHLKKCKNNKKYSSFNVLQSSPKTAHDMFKSDLLYLYSFHSQ